MERDDYLQAWSGQSSQTRVTVNADLLLKEVQRSQRQFQTTIFWRDFREVVVALVMLPLWFFLGMTFSLPWTWYLTVPALLWVIGFFLVDRMRQKQNRIGPSETLREWAKDSLTQVEHQIWLLRNIVWWYLLPFAIPLVAFFAQVCWLKSEPSGGGVPVPAQAGMFLILCTFVFAIYGFIYFLNQYSVRTQLEPRRQELLTLIASLEDGKIGEGGDSYPILLGQDRAKCSGSPLRVFIAILCAVTILFLALATVAFLSGRSPFVGEKSPFTAVRWQQSQPEVKVGDKWFTLVSIDDLPASEIVAFSQLTYNNQWQKRFEEDLVLVLTGMDHPPKETVRLVVMPMGSQELQTLNRVPMTRSNRQAIWNANQARRRVGDREVPRDADQ